jgi:hypothetical protein
MDLRVIGWGDMAVLKTSFLWNITPCSPLKVNRRFGGTYRLHLQSRRISQARNQLGAGSIAFLFGLFFYPEDGDMFSETSVHFQETTRRYIPEETTLHNHRCENLEPYILIGTF